MKKFLIWLLLLFSSNADAVVFNKAPCSPVFLANNQGRPLPDAVVSIVDSMGIAVTAFNDPAGATLFPSTIPANQILQFFVTMPGQYQVTVTASGAIKTYWTICGYGLTNIISIDRTARSMVDSISTNQPVFSPSSNGSPDEWLFVDDDILTLDFIAPTFPTTFDSFLLSTEVVLGSSACTLTWILNMCTFENGETVCNIVTATNTVSPSNTTLAVVGARQDFLVTSWSSFVYDPSDHVIISIKKQAGGCANGVVQNVRIEFNR